MSYVALSNKSHRIYLSGGNKLAATAIKYEIDKIDFDRYAAHRKDDGQSLDWRCLFVLPEWLKVWWQEFGGASRPSILRARHQDDVIGLAPLMFEGQRAALIGGADVCDYLDFIVNPAQVSHFCNLLLDYLGQRGISELDLGPARADSTVLSGLVRIAEDRGCKVSVARHDISLEMKLPATWDEYLGRLKGKQRHEVKRKFRRLHEAAEINFRVVESAEQADGELDVFFALFKASADEKADFLTPKMESYFRSLVKAMAQARMLKLFYLDLDAEPAAACLCFDFNSRRHLYNSGFDPRWRSLSAGLMCNILSIKDAIANGCSTYDFLKGPEIYKSRLGGEEIPLNRCRIQL